MNIAFAAYRDGIAQLLRYSLDNHQFATLRWFFFLQSAKREYGEVGTGLGSEIFSTNFPP